MKIAILVSALFLSASAFAGDVNCMWVETHYYQAGKKKRIESIHVGAYSIHANLEQGQLIDPNLTNVSVLFKPEVKPQTVTSFGIFDTTMYLTFYETGDTSPIIFTIQTKPNGKRSEGLFSGTVRYTMPAGNTFDYPVRCSVDERSSQPPQY